MDSQTRGNVVAGAIVSLVFVPYPGVPLLGGALAGYLEGEGPRWGVRVGLLTGLVALGVSIALAALPRIPVVTAGGFVDPLWEGFIHPLSEGFVPLLVLPLVGGGVGAHVHRETAD
jgi:hypothetical protein